MNRAQALGAAATIIAGRVADIAALAVLLDGAGCSRLANALRERGAGPAGVGGSPHPDAEFWRREAEKMLGWGRP